MNGNRILSIELKNIKTVQNGMVESSLKKPVERGELENHPCDIVGVYGQNGSGKTTVIDALGFLKNLARGIPLNFVDPRTGRRVEGDYDYLLDVNSDSGSLLFTCLIYVGDEPYEIYYSIELGWNESRDHTILRSETFDVFPSHPGDSTFFKLHLAPFYVDYGSETLRYLYDGTAHTPNYVLGPQSLKTGEFEIYTRLNARKAECIRLGTSFLFDNTSIDFLRSSPKEDVRKMGDVIQAFKSQCIMQLFVFNKALDRFNGDYHLAFFDDTSAQDKTKKRGVIPLSSRPFTIPSELKETYDRLMKEINLFVSSFVPGFELYVDSISHSVSETGKEEQKIAIYRKMGNRRLPLGKESAGIRKLLSIAIGFISVYGDSSSWLAVDELDSGVFENLLGQLLQVLEQNGKGQLIFTAHNLAPLERISPSSIVFTTSNPQNRYIKFSGIKKTNNLRDLYIRALKLGGQSEELTSPVDLDDLDSALWSAYKSYSKEAMDAES